MQFQARSFKDGGYAAMLFGEGHEEIVYGIDALTGQAVFGPRSDAESIQRMFDVVEAKTWGEVRGILKPAEFAQLKEGYTFRLNDTDDPTYEPADDEPFDPDDAAAYSDGDWPLPLTFRMDWLPQDLVDRYGEKVTTMLNGDYLAIEPKHLEDVANALRARGYTCTWDDKLVWNRR